MRIRGTQFPDVCKTQKGREERVSRRNWWPTVPDIRERLIRAQNDLLGFTDQSVTGHFEGLFQRILRDTLV